MCVLDNWTQPSAVFTFVSGIRPVWCWCCPTVVSAACSVAPAASPLTKLCVPSPSGCDHIQRLLCSSPFRSPTRADKHRNMAAVNRSMSCFLNDNVWCNLLQIYLSLFNLLLPKLRDLLQALGRWLPIAAGTKTRDSNQRGFNLRSSRLSLQGVLLVITLAFLLTPLFNLGHPSAATRWGNKNVFSSDAGKSLRNKS